MYACESYKAYLSKQSTTELRRTLKHNMLCSKKNLIITDLDVLQ